MVISDEAFDKMRECWAASIPKAYKLTKQEHAATNYTVGAIIAPPPPAALLFRFFFLLSPMHLTANQRKAKAAREKMGKAASKRSKGQSWNPRARPSRAKARPSLPPISVSFSDVEEIDIPYFT